MPSNTTQTGPWWQIKALATAPEAPSAAEIHIYSDIGESWDDSTIAARTFVAAIAALSVDTLTVRINSFGGSVPDGLAIFNALRRHPATVAVEIDGIAASIASLIAMAGDSVNMAANALMMVHAPWAAALGNAQTLRSAADTLDHFANAMSAAYARPGFSREDALALLTDGQDHWYTADEALTAGLIDTMTPALAIAASVPARFRPVAAATQPPEAIMPTPAAPSATEPQPAVNLADITAKAAVDARAALSARTATLKTRFEAFSRAHPSRVDAIRAVFDVALTDLDQTPEQFTDAVLAKFAETLDEPIAGAHTTRASIGEDQRDKLVHACTDALLVRAAVPLAQRPDLNGNPFKGKTLARIAEDALVRAGVKVSGMDPMQIVAAAFTQTSSDFPVLMENVMHKALLAGYTVAADTWRRFCAVGSVSDFRAHNRYMLGSLGDLVDLNEAGEFQNQSIPDGRKQSVSVSTKGVMLNLTRQAIINDDLGNIAATAGAPSVTTVESGILAMAAQKDLSGNDYLDLGLAIESHAIPLMVVNPKAAKRFAEALSTRTKTDAVDAAMLAEFAQRMPFEPWVRPAATALRCARLHDVWWY